MYIYSYTEYGTYYRIIYILFHKFGYDHLRQYEVLTLERTTKKILIYIFSFCAPTTWTYILVVAGEGSGEWVVTKVELWGRGFLWCCCVSWQRAWQKVPHLGQSEAVHSGGTNRWWGSPRWLSEQCMFFKILLTKLVNSDSTKRTGIPLSLC